MVLEATMIIIDNSEYMRNGDYLPSRYGAQSDAVNVIFTRKTNANPENTVGLMTMAGKTPQVLVTPTTDIGKILSALHESAISSEADITTSLQVAQLALKHRQNKNQRQRIICFVASPLRPKAEEKQLVKLAKKLKKNNVAVDVVSFGEDEVEENESLLRAFVEGVQSGENSHLVTVPTGTHLLSDAIVSSPILAGEDGVPGGFGGGEDAGGGGGDHNDFGVDPNLDPELALALRMSLEEEQARLAAQQGPPTATAAATSSLAPIPETSTSAVGAAPMDEDAEDEAELAAALLLSKKSAGGEEDVEMDDEEGEEDEDDEDDDEGGLGDEEMSEEEAIARAIEMSMEEESNAPKDASKPPPKK